MKPEELRNLSKDELRQKERGLKEELFKLNAQRFGGRLEKPHMYSLIKRDIARIQTILNEKNINNMKNPKSEIINSKQIQNPKQKL